jgi:hemolysin III
MVPHQSLVRPRWRGRLHTWAFASVLPAGILLLASLDHAMARVSAAVFVTSLALVFGTSAAYHRLTTTPVAAERMRRLDHSMIYVLIAGTYTPVCLLALPPAWGIPLLAVVWTGAVVGIVLKQIDLVRFRVPAAVLYMVMGWAAIVATPVIFSNISRLAFGLMVAGGVAYTLGALVFWRRRPDPRPAVFGYHEIWHAFTIAAGGCHFAMIWLVAAS